MALLRMEDDCVIKRTLKDGRGDILADEYDEPKTQVVYDGKCCYQAGGQTSLSVTVRNDVVYLSGNKTLFYSGDIIEIATKQGRKRNGVIRVVRDITMPLSRQEFTKIEIEQSMGN